MNQLFNYNYTYELATNTSSYQSVSELKRLYEEPRIEIKLLISKTVVVTRTKAKMLKITNALRLFKEFAILKIRLNHLNS